LNFGFDTFQDALLQRIGFVAVNRIQLIQQLRLPPVLQKGEANLPKPSVVNVSQILTVGKENLMNYIGRLRGAALVLDGLHLLFDNL
jgi:mRNA-degrading endonuclease toxin of MazEF toxin-antitoxin module